MPMTKASSTPTLADIKQASVRIASYIHHTPIMTSQLINKIAGCRISFKCENLQKGGAFKARGACNAVMKLSPEQAVKGVATHSSGNHGAALALAAANRNIAAYVVLPKTAPEIKRQAVVAYGAEVIDCEPTLESRIATLANIVNKTGAHFVPPYDDTDVISGQGTAALEVMDQLAGAPNSIVTPVGGGGLLSGTAIVTKSSHINCKVYGAEPAGADDAFHSFNSGIRVTEQTPNTVADGLKTTLGVLNFKIIARLADGILVVDDKQIISAMQLIWSRMKLVVEPSAAVPLAAVLAYKNLFEGQHIVIILSGGNVDLNELPWHND